MDFYQKYELIEPLTGEGTRSFRARQRATSRTVSVHLLVGGKTPENESLLARLRGMPPQSMSKLIEVGDNDGTVYVVTIAPPYHHLNEWLDEQERAAAPPGEKEFTRAGTWKVPTQPGPAVEPAPAAPVAPVAPPPPPKPPVTPAKPGEFIRMVGPPNQAGPAPMRRQRSRSHLLRQASSRRCFRRCRRRLSRCRLLRYRSRLVPRLANSQRCSRRLRPSNLR